MSQKRKVNRCVFQGTLQLVSFQREYCFFDNYSLGESRTSATQSDFSQANGKYHSSEAALTVPPKYLFQSWELSHSVEPDPMRFSIAPLFSVKIRNNQVSSRNSK